MCAAARLRFNYEQPVHFEQALTGLEDYNQLTTGNFGFVSKSALGCLCDQVTLQKLQDYLDGRVSARSPQNLLEQLFLPMVQQQNHPGSWADWTLPENQCRLPVFTTGWGAGEYPVYWGQDAEGRVCQLVSWFVDLHAMQGADPVVEEALEELEEALIWEDDCYKGQVCLEDWDAFFEKEQPIDLMVRPGNCDDQQVIDACRYLLTEQYRLLDVMMTGLFEQYPLMQLQYGYTRADNHPEMPNLLDKMTCGSCCAAAPWCWMCRVAWFLLPSGQAGTRSRGRHQRLRGGRDRTGHRCHRSGLGAAGAKSRTGRR